MTLEYITEYIDRKIYKNPNIITVTFYELRIKEDLSKEDTFIFLQMSKQRLVNLGYRIYETGQRYKMEDKEKLVRSNVLYVAIKNDEFGDRGKKNHSKNRGDRNDKKRNVKQPLKSDANKRRGRAFK